MCGFDTAFDGMFVPALHHILRFLIQRVRCNLIWPRHDYATTHLKRSWSAHSVDSLIYFISFFVFRIRFPIETTSTKEKYFFYVRPHCHIRTIWSEYKTHAFFSAAKVIIDDALRCARNTHNEFFRKKILRTKQRGKKWITFYSSRLPLKFMFCLFFISRLCVNKGDLCICNKSS